MNLGDKIRARREALGFSQADLGARAGTSQQAIDRIEKGAKGKHLLAVLKALSLDHDGNLQSDARHDGNRTTSNLIDDSNSLPLHASAEGGNGELIVTTEEIGRVPRPAMLASIRDAYAILITGSSMCKAYEPGDRAIVHPNLPPKRDTDVILYRTNDVDGETRAMIKRLIGWTETHWIVEQHNPERKFKLSRHEWTRIHRVVGNYKPF